MNRLKQGIKIAMMFVLLFAIVCAPLGYMEYQNRRMIDKITLSPIRLSWTDSVKEPAQDYNFWERIGMVNQSVRVQSSALTEFGNESVADLAAAGLVRTMEEQLKKLCEYNALPELELSEPTAVSVFKETYTSADEANQSDLSLSVWEITAEYENYYICAYMDAEISALYDITIIAESQSIIYDAGASAAVGSAGFIYDADISEVGFLKYLLDFSPVPDVKERDELFTANAYYSEDTIVLRLYSVNKETNRYTSYRFGK